MDDQERIEQLDRLLSNALDRDDAGRRALLEEVRGRDLELARQLESLLRQADRIDEFLEAGAASARDALLAEALAENAAANPGVAERIGSCVGPYRILRQIGVGARSEVYLAVRDDAEWDQQVAVKILSRGVNTDDVLRRFLAERQILSELRHPNIATLLDGGVTDDGLPYFVMEHIDGLPITGFCHAHALRLSDRVRIFRQVCETIAFAQRHLVVHRDIKPSNILVTADGTVKLLDFGIAKLLDPGDRSAFSPMTLDTARPMTPAYASPEQLAGEPITTATDVYQLGLLLVEMLTGVPNAKRALGIESRNPPLRAPSKLMNREETPGGYAARELRGDLDCIALKALEPAPDDRYSSAAKMLFDLESYLGHRAISARPPTPYYRLRKFARRQPAVSATALLLLLAGTTYVGTLVWFNAELRRERLLAIDAAERAEEVKELLIRFIASPDPYTGMGADARVSDMLDRAESVIAQELAGRPETQAELYGAVADVYRNLDLNDRAVAMLQKEIDSRTQLEGGRSLAVLAAKRKLAQVLLVHGQTGEALELLGSVGFELAARYPEAWTERAVVERELGSYETVYGSAAEAVPHFDASIDMLQRAGDAPLEMAASLYQLSLAYEALGRFEDGRDVATRAHDIHLRLQGPEHVNTLRDRAMIAMQLSNLGEYQEAADIYREIIVPLENRLGPLNSQLLAILNNVAYTNDLAGDAERAAELHENVLARNRERFGDTHRAVADSLQNLGSIYTRLRRYELAIPKLLEASRIYLAVNEPGNPVTAYPEISLAILYGYTDEPVLLERHARKAIRLLRGNVPETHPAWLKTQCLLGDALIRRGDSSAGVPLVETGIRGLEGQANIPSTHLEDCRAVLERAGVSSLQAASGGP